MALKRINKKQIDEPKRIEHIKTEKKILEYLNHKTDPESSFIVKLIKTFSDQNYLCFVFEYL